MSLNSKRVIAMMRQKPLIDIVNTAVVVENLVFMRIYIGTKGNAFNASVNVVLCENKRSKKRFLLMS